MGDIIFIILTVVYFAAWVFYLCERRQRSKPISKETIERLEQMIKNYRP